MCTSHTTTTTTTTTTTATVAVSRRSSSSSSASKSKFSKTKTFILGTAMVLFAITLLAEPVAADYGCPIWPADCPKNCVRFGFKTGACGGFLGIQ
ncbi:hypothetical protein BGZ97_013333, partial [Linnemannia gamsii]